MIFHIVDHVILVHLNGIYCSLISVIIRLTSGLETPNMVTVLIDSQIFTFALIYEKRISLRLIAVKF